MFYMRNSNIRILLATSLASEVQSMEHVRVHNDLADIIYSFEPTQNF